MHHPAGCAARAAHANPSPACAPTAGIAAYAGGICECTGEADPTLHPRITRTVSMGHTDLDVAFEGVAPKPAEEEETIKILLTPAQASDKHLAMEHTAGVASMTLTNISALEHAAPTSKTCHTVCRAAQKASDLIDSLRGAGV